MEVYEGLLIAPRRRLTLLRKHKSAFSENESWSSENEVWNSEIQCQNSNSGIPYFFSEFFFLGFLEFSQTRQCWGDRGRRVLLYNEERVN